MTEQYRDIAQFDSTPVSEALAALAWNTHDVAHGAGQALSIAEGMTVLEVYPDAAVARVTTQDARVELFRVPGYSVDADRGRVVFEQGQDDDRSRLIVAGDGRLSLHPVLRATDSSQTGDAPRADANPVHAVLASSEITRSPVENSREARETDEVTLQGRLGRDPRFPTADPPEARFPLAINHDDRRRADWHEVVCFDAAAETLREQFRRREIVQGRLVDVTGQPVVREEVADNGKVKKIKEFHATAVTRVRATKQR